MTEHDYENSASGYIVETFEGLCQTFTDVEILHTSEMNIIAKAKRYGRWWFLKGLRKDIASEAGYQQRLRKELEILMQLQHPGIVSAVGMEVVGELGECIVMEFVDGVTLKEWLKDAITRPQRRRVAKELTEVVSYVHTKGIVHRDLKPENILITTNGENVKLVDFGLADTDSHTILKQPAGTLRYMSPEQQQTAVADVRNDIYSLGIIFNEMKLGYGNIVKKSLLPSEKRYQNMGELTDAIRAREKRKMILSVTGVVAMFFLLTGLVGIQTVRQNNYALQAIENQSELEATIAMLTDSLNQMTVLHQQLVDEQSQQRIGRQRVEDAVSKGKAEIDKIIKKSGLKQHFDTLSNFIYLNEELFIGTLQHINMARKTFIEQLAADYTESEISEISQRITDYHSKCGETLGNRYNQMKTEYDRKIMQGN